MDEFRQHLNQFYANIEQLENVNVKHCVEDIELIGRQLKYSQEFLFKEIQRLKEDLNVNSTRLNQANELRDIDQKTLQTFKSKFQDLAQLLAEIRMKELHTSHLVQILRVNTSRLWYIFESTTGSSITQEILFEDLENLLHHFQLQRDEQRSNLILLEHEHADLLLKLKETQLSLENFRTIILQITRNTSERKLQIHNQQQINARLYEQTANKINQIIFNTADIQRLLRDYKSLVQEIDHLLKLIFQTQTHIEMHQKSILIYQTKLEKYQQDLTVAMLNRTSDEHQLSDLKKIIHRQNENLKQLDHQQTQMVHNRRRLHRKIDFLEQEKARIINQQEELLEIIKQTTIKTRVLEKQIVQSNQTSKIFQHTQRKLTQEQNKHQEITNQLQRTIDMNERRVRGIQSEIHQFTTQIHHENQQIDSAEDRIELQTKEFNDLEMSFSTTHEELLHHRTKVNESQIRVKSLTQKMHKLIVDEKPLMKEIAQDQRQIMENQINHTRLEVHFKQNESKIRHYETMITKLIRDYREEEERSLMREKFMLGQCQDQTENSKEEMKRLNQNFEHSDKDYQNLKEVSHRTENENRRLKQQYIDLTFIVQLLGQRQAILQNQLKPFYDKIKYLTNHHLDKIKTIEQSKSDLILFHQYYQHLQSHHYRLHQSLAFLSEHHYEYLHCQSLSSHFQNEIHAKIKNQSNEIHYWQTLMIHSPEKFDRISKFLLIKTKLVKKSNELQQLKEIFRQKNTLYQYLNSISRRRQRLIEKPTISRR